MFLSEKKTFFIKNLIIFAQLNFNAGVVKLVDTLDLGSSASRLGGSSPFTRTKKTSIENRGFFMALIVNFTNRIILFKNSTVYLLITLL